MPYTYACVKRALREVIGDEHARAEFMVSLGNMKAEEYKNEMFEDSDSSKEIIKNLTAALKAYNTRTEGRF